MQATLDDLSIMVLVDGGDAVFHIDALKKGASFWAAPQSLIRHYPSLLEQLGDIKQIPLRSQDVLDANDELRSLLQEEDRRVLHTTFWYNLGKPEDKIVLTIDDLDPKSHSVIAIGSFTGSLSSCSPHSARFLKKIRQSELCTDAEWDNFNHINVTLNPNAAKHMNRLRTFTTLLEFF